MRRITTEHALADFSCLSLVIVVVCAGGCWQSQNNRKYPDDNPEWIAEFPVPTEEEVGGEETDFFFQYLCGGGYNPQEVFRFAVTTNEDVVLQPHRILAQLRGTPHNSKAVYLVSLETADEIEKIIIEREFYDWKSTPALWMSDGDGSEIVTKISRGNHRVVFGAKFYNFGPTPHRQRYQVSKSDPKATIRGKNFYNLVYDIYQIVKKDGKLIRQEGISVFEEE